MEQEADSATNGLGITNGKPFCAQLTHKSFLEMSAGCWKAEYGKQERRLMPLITMLT